MSTTVFGQKIDMPLFLAPTAMHRLYHHDGEKATSRAAEKFGTFFGMSTIATTSIEEVGNLTSGPKLFQLYIHKDRGLTDNLVERCQRANFKADDQFLNLSIAMHYKKLLAISDTSKYHFYFVLGPSLDTRLSAQSADNLVNNNYARFLLRGDLGFEFENKNFYTLFLHYKQGLTSFTKSPIKTNINSFELGMMIKAIDLF